MTRGKVRFGLGVLVAVIVPCLVAAAVALGAFSSGDSGGDIQHWYEIHDGSRFTELLDPPPVSPAGSDYGAARVGGAAAAAAAELIDSDGDSAVGFDPITGLWARPVPRPPRGAPQASPMWWQSALAMRALLRYGSVTGSDSAQIQHVVRIVYGRGIHGLEAHWRINFKNSYLDDTGWWGLAWASAAGYELQMRHDAAAARRYVRLAEFIARYIAGAPHRCGAGINFTLSLEPSTITNEEYIALTAQLAILRQAPGPLHNPQLASHWLDQAQRVLGWLEHSGLVNMTTGTVKGGMRGACRRRGRAMTYTEGEMAEALTQVGVATHQPSYFRQAQRFLDAIVRPGSLMVANGVLQEPCEGQYGQCRLHSYNIVSFKGITADAFTDWTLATGSRRYVRFLHRQAMAVASDASGIQPSRACATPAGCVLSLYWARWIPAGRDPVPPTPGSQESGLSAMTDALAVDRVLNAVRGERT